MTNEIIEKIEKLISGDISAQGRSLHTPVNESEVQHLFTLSRKLIERVPITDRKNYATLKFYCDWTLHSEIDKSAEGARILAQINEIIFDNLKKPDNSNLIAELTSALSFSSAREQLNNIIFSSGGKKDIIAEDIWRNEILPVFAEIISSSPIRINNSPRFTAIKNYIKSRPLKGTSTVEEISIIKISRKLFDPIAREEDIVFCLLIVTTDTTKFILPLVP